MIYIGIPELFSSDLMNFLSAGIVGSLMRLHEMEGYLQCVDLAYHVLGQLNYFSENMPAFDGHFNQSFFTSFPLIQSVSI